MEYDIIIIGAGPAGIISALEASKNPNARIALLDEGSHLGSKLAISGGGKCNITNMEISPRKYSQAEFVQYALRAFPLQKTMEMIQNCSLEIEEREHGRIFFRKSVGNFLEYLSKQLAEANIAIYYNTRVENIVYKDSLYYCKTDSGILQSKILVLATGSSAWKKEDRTKAICKALRNLGHTVHAFRSALAPLYINNCKISALSGVSLNVTITAGIYTVQDTLLFTHKGISGPATLRASSYWEKETPVILNFLPTQTVQMLLEEHRKKTVKNALQVVLPNRFVEELFPRNILEQNSSEISKKDKTILEGLLHSYAIVPTAIAPLQKAEVARGGVEISEVNAKTMESRISSNLYIVGELLDVIGDLGGYNIHFAFASGYLAGNHIRKKIVDTIS